MLQVDAVRGLSVLEAYMLVAVVRLQRRGGPGGASFERAFAEYESLQRLHRRKLAQRAALRPAGLAHLVCGSVGRRRRGSPRPQNPLEAHKIYPQASAGKTRSPWNKDRRYHCAPAGRLVQKRSGQQFFLIQSSPFSTDTHMCAADPKVLTSSLSTPNQTL